MKRTILVGMLAGVLALVGCSDGQPEEIECPQGFDVDFRPELQGLSLLEATQIVAQDGGTIRVLFDNGEHLDATADYREDRVNVALDHNIVICSSKG
jgi:hypothetical protein